MSEQTTSLSEKVLVLETRVEHLDERVSELGGFIKEVRSLSENIAILSTKVQMTLDQLGKQEHRIKTLEDADADKWRSTIKYIISATVGGIITYIFSTGGLS